MPMSSPACWYVSTRSTSGCWPKAEADCRGSGRREAGLLHAAVARPFATFLGEELYPTDFEKAAALFHSLIKSHPFMDGTKRTAFASALFFLSERGYRPGKPLPMDEIIEFCVSLAEENLRIAGGEESDPRSIAQIAAWFQGLFSLDE